MSKSYQFCPTPPLGIPKCIHGVWENNHSGLTRIKIAFQGSDNFGSNPLYFTFCIKTLPDMSSADNFCKRSGPTFCSGLIGVQTVRHFIGYDKLNRCILFFALNLYIMTLSSANNHFKQFGPRSGLTFCPDLIGVQTI